MTYCLAIQFNDGLVFCSDSRTNAGPDRVSTYSKMHRFNVANERSLVLLTAGNLATSQAVVAQLHRDLADDSEMNIAKARYVSEVADYIGQISSVERSKYQKLGGPDAEGFDASATFILGGQIKGAPSELYLIYPEGNHITASEQHPYLQIGETKYGKPILDLFGQNVGISEADAEVEDAKILIDVTHRVAAELNIILVEKEDI